MREPPSAPGRSNGRLLIRLRSGDAAADDGALADALTPEGWRLLGLNCDAAISTNAAIRDALTRAGAAQSETIVLAERGCAAAAAAALLRQKEIAGRCGLVTFDAFADERFAALGEDLEDCEGLATIWTVARDNRDLRVRTLAHHGALQARGRDTHFLALPGASQSLAGYIADERSPLGRAFRWLIMPVNSR